LTGNPLVCTCGAVTRVGSDRLAESNDRRHDEERWLRALNDALRVIVRCPSLLESSALEELATTLARHVSIEGLTVVLSGEGTQSIHRALLDRAEAVFRSSVTFVGPLHGSRLALPEEPRTSTDTGANELPLELSSGVDCSPYAILPIPGTDLDSAPSGAAAHLVLFFRESAAAAEAPLEFLRALAGLIGSKLGHAQYPKSPIVAAEREAASHLGRIRLLEKELRTLLDNAPLIIFRLDPSTGQLLYLNRHAERLLRVPTDEALRTPGFLQSAHADPEALKAFDEAFDNARRGVHSPPYEARLVGNLDAEIAVRGTIYPLLSDEGGVVAIEGILADVSTEHAARSRLVQADRLSTLGMLAASVAHEINNPAAFLVLGLEQLERFLALGSPGRSPAGVRPKLDARALVADLRESIDRIVRIARDLRLFAGSPGEGSRLARVDVSDAVQSALTLARAQLIERASVTLDLAPVPPILMEDGRLGQVLVNLLVNAAQAVAKQPGYGHLVNVTTRASAGVIEIAVSDTGVGVRPEDLERIWLPFFTTKSTDFGTGLGLSISREIIEKAGGSIRVESPTVVTHDQAHGSRFVISLPSAEPDQPRAPAAASASKWPRRRRRILVVDDERALASALASALGRVHDVAIAGDGRKALELMAEQRFDAVLCDLCMPDISGETVYLHERERNRSHAGVFIFMTGIGFGGDVEGFLASTGRPYLEKPFSLERALDAIEHVAAS
jgi:signal transduction histidine kinase/CheY-like chemotaxis protein